LSLFDIKSRLATGLHQVPAGIYSNDVSSILLSFLRSRPGIRPFLGRELAIQHFARSSCQLNISRNVRAQATYLSRRWLAGIYQLPRDAAELGGDALRGVLHRLAHGGDGGITDACGRSRQRQGRNRVAMLAVNRGGGAAQTDAVFLVVDGVAARAYGVSSAQLCGRVDGLVGLLGEAPEAMMASTSASGASRPAAAADAGSMHRRRPPGREMARINLRHSTCAT
jgi:hypothetical protein